MRKVLVGVVLMIALGSSAFACKTDDAVYSPQWLFDPMLANQNYNDFGRIHEDAENPACAEAAKDRLIAKLQSALANPATFTAVRDGYFVAHIFAAAHRLGANGWATKELDQLLSTNPATPGAATVEGRYVFNIDPGCDDVNTCMDEYAGAAPAYAWIAAYRQRRGYDSVTVNQDLAMQNIRNALTSVCIHDEAAFNASTKTEICNGSLSDLWDGTGKTLSMNHAPDRNNGLQMVSYGFGLMPSIASAIIGLEASGYYPTFTSDEQRIARALFEEAQAHTASNTFQWTCAKIQRDAPGAAWRYLDLTQFCGGDDPWLYQATMYRLDRLYQDYFGGIPGNGTGFQSNTYNLATFGLSPGDNGLFSFGRYVGFIVHGYEWLANRPEFLPVDNNNPIGYLEGITAGGVANGWTCDQDVLGKSIFVSFLVDSQYFVMNAKANLPSEPAIRAYCGGDAHRFSVQLPAWTQGRSVSAFGLDYTWYGHTYLPCLNSPGCGW